jgi:predicted short-subunit dehydrogenase-like oxidoreductase (DUF2520 family)
MSKAKSQGKKPSVVIIGPGRLGSALALALRASGYPILGFVSRRTDHARKAARLVNRSEKLVRPQPLAEVAQMPSSDLVLITTPDDAIEETARRLAANERGASGKAGRRTVLHTSGALSSEVLAPLAESGFYTGSMHPLISVSEPLAGAKALHGAFFCLEGDKTALKLARKIVADLSGTSFSIRPEDKALYHAAAVMASPHLVALLDLAIEMLVACGLSQKSAREVLLPLLESTVDNLKVKDPRRALTGTFVRGDLATVKRHLSVLSRKEFAEALEVYKLLGLHSIRLASRNGLDETLLKQIRQVLESEDASKKSRP